MNWNKHAMMISMGHSAWALPRRIDPKVPHHGGGVSESRIPHNPNGYFNGLSWVSH